MAVALLFTACSAARGKGLSGTSKKELAESLTKYMERMDIHGSLYAVYHGDTIIDISRGSNSGKGSDIVYAVASVTKQITASCVMKLYEQGKLDIEDKLSKYFPDYRYGDKITVKQLMYQRSGIPDFSVDSHDGAVWVSCDNSEKEIELKRSSTAEENEKLIRELFLSCDLLFEPEEYFYYSDSNFSLLAEIVAQVSGMSFHEYVRANIFKPLGMDTASFIDDHSYGPEVTIAKTDTKEFDYDYFDYKGAEYGCGDMMAAPADLYKWYKGLTRGKVVSDKYYKMMTESYSAPDELGYGFGLMISDTEDCKALFHYGWIPSYYSSVFMVPDYDLFITLLANGADGNPHGTASVIAGRIANNIGADIGSVE